jgi:hypothetical protein
MRMPPAIRGELPPPGPAPAAAPNGADPAAQP